MSDMTEETRTGSPVKVGYLVTGLVFLGLSGTWALSASGTVDGLTVGWMLPAILVGAGVIGLIAMLAGSVGRRPPRDADTAPPVEEGAATPEEDVAFTPEEDER